MQLAFRMPSPLDTNDLRPGIGPWGKGPFLRAKPEGVELVIGIWALISEWSIGRGFPVSSRPARPSSSHCSSQWPPRLNAPSKRRRRW